MTVSPTDRELWLAALGRTIVAHEGEGAETNTLGSVVLYAKENREDGWNLWALRRRRGGLARESHAYRRCDTGRLYHAGNLHHDVFTPRVFQALEAHPPLGEALMLVDQIEVDEWLALYHDTTEALR